MNVKTFVDLLVQSLAVIAIRTETKIDDELQAFVKAVQASPELIAYIQSKIDAATSAGGDDGVPNGVFTMEQMPDDIRPRAEMIGLGTWAKMIPILLELYRIWKSASGG